MKKAFFLMVLVCISHSFVPQDTNIQLPVTKVSLYSSGLGFFEHQGVVTGSVRITIQVPSNAVNDILKSLVIRDDAGDITSVEYKGANSVLRSLQGLKIDLSGNPGLPEIIGRLKGELIEIKIPDTIKGRIVSVEPISKTEIEVDYRLLILTDTGLSAVLFSEINSFTFPDTLIAKDFDKALDLLREDKYTNTRSIEILCSGKSTRPVSISYVIPVPIWKPSYRLDLSGKKNVFQGWAIIDNDGNFDWTNIRLSLVTGRPVSFIQNLFDPYYIDRPIVPLAIAETAPILSYQSGYNEYVDESSTRALYSEMAAPAPDIAMAKKDFSSRDSRQDNSVNDLEMKTAAKPVVTGEQFFYTLKEPVSLLKQQSVMVPLHNGEIKASRVSVISGDEIKATDTYHPMLCVELENNTELKLPAGPLTVYDAGIYAGDALLDYIPENGKRLLAFGQDLSVSVFSNSATSYEFRTVKIIKGNLIMNRAQVYDKKYTIKNIDSKAKNIILEHRSKNGAILTNPQKADEQIPSGYRFRLNVNPGSEMLFIVREEQPLEERIALAPINSESYLSYISTNGISERIKTALNKAAVFRQNVEKAEQAVTTLQVEMEGYERSQERIRLNLEAAGRDSQQGKDYLRKLSESDKAIEDVTNEILKMQKQVSDARAVYETYLSGLTLE